MTIFTTPSILVLGKNGQLARALHNTAPNRWHITYMGRQTLDLTNPTAVEQTLRHQSPALIINAAAYTQVDNAESEPDTAHALNHHAVQTIATYCAQHAIPLIHISTDFVFDGKAHTPYQPQDPVAPLGVYGASKAAGEVAIVNAGVQQAVILRTAWLYSEFRKNFLTTMLSLMAERESLSVVYDQIGTPTSAQGLALAIWQVVETLLAEKAKSGQGVEIHHWTDAGVASWYDFAENILQYGRKSGLISGQGPTLEPIASHQYPTPARRPHYSVLDKSTFADRFGLKPVHWQIQLKSTITALAHSRRLQHV